MPPLSRFNSLAFSALILSLSGIASGVDAASHYVPDPNFPAVGLTAPIVQPMGLMPLSDGGALVSCSTGFSFGDGQPSGALLRLGPSGAIVSRQWAGASAAFLASAGSNGLPAWVQLGNGRVLEAQRPSSASGSISLVQLALDGTIDPSLSLSVAPPSLGGAGIAGLWRLADGSVMVAGQFSAVGGHATRNLAHLTAAGAVDPAYTCQLPLSGPYDVGSDGAVVGVNPAPSTSLTGQPSLVRLDASAVVTDSWILTNYPTGTFVALEASGNVLMALNPSNVVAPIPVSTSLAGTGTMIAPVFPVGSTALYRFIRGVAAPVTVFTNPSTSSSPAMIAGLTVLADGSILLLGGPTGLYPTQTPGLIHLSAAGVIDTSFSVSGLNGEVIEQVIRGSAGWFIESEGLAPNAQHWREFSGDFTTQLTFDPDLRTGASASAAVALPDNSILWEGTFLSPNRTVQSYVRSGPDGTVDYAHVPLTPEAASSQVAAVGADGSIYLIAAAPAITVVTESGQTAAAVVTAALGPAELERYRSDGTWDAAFGRPALTGPNSSLSSVAIDGQGRVLLSGAAGGAYPDGVWPVAQRLLPSGAPDATFAAAEPNLTTTSFLSGVPLPDSSGYLLLDTQANLMTVDLSGKAFGTNYKIQGAQQLYATGANLFLRGYFATVLGSPSPNLQRLGSDGLPDPTWHSGLSTANNLTQVQALADGRVLAVGFTSAVLTRTGAIDLNDPIPSGVLPVATGDGALTTLGPSGVIRRFVLRSLLDVSLQADAPLGQVAPGKSLTLTAAASAQTAGPVVWRHNGAVVTGVSGNQLTIANVTGSDGGWYSVGVPTAQGVVFTSVWVRVTPYAARIGNASVRVYFADTKQSLVTGTLIQGASAEPALLRFLGPSLGMFGLTDLAQGFGVSYYANGKSLMIFPLAGFTFPVYGGSEPLADTLALAGAFPALGLSSEIQLRLTLSSGINYTTSTTAVQPGTALFELYLPEPPAAMTGRKLTNFSCLSAVGSGDRILVLGFTIDGTQPLPVLVRGVGPALQAFGIASPVSAPLLQLYSAHGALLGSNTQWGSQANAGQIATAAAAVGAFPLALGSADAALLLTLPPGAYSAVLSPQGAPGQGMIELYEASLPN